MSRVLVAVALGLLALVPVARAHVKRSASRWSFDGLGLPTPAFNGIGRSGTGVLKGRRQGSGHPEGGASAPIIMQWDETFDVGVDTDTPGRRPGLPGAVLVHRQAREADAQDRSAEAASLEARRRA